MTRPTGPDPDPAEPVGEPVVPTDGDVTDAEAPASPAPALRNRERSEKPSDDGGLNSDVVSQRAEGSPASPAAAEEIPEAFPPTLREVLLRPQWIGMLLLCLVVAGVFAWLGQWQLGRAIDTNPPPPGMTEEVQPLADIAGPGENLPEPYVGQRVEATGEWIPGDFLVVQKRYNDGVEGYWVTGQLRLDGTDEPTSIAVAIGWAATEEDALAAVEALEGETGKTVEVLGRLISDEGAGLPPRGADPQTLTRMSSAALLGQWHDVEELNVYRPYLASVEPSGGLVAISSPAPDEGSAVNWLNIFYAVEWAIFAGFAFYLWYRLAKDAWERELEDFEDEDAEPAAS